jgi:hypothetical protein
MRKRTRTTLFFSLLFAFALFTPAVILYSQGYRLDFEKRKITQTGGIFLKVEPKQVEIYINDKLAKKTNFFFDSALLENLLPGEYKITLKKEGYYLWEKNLEVKEKQVTGAKNIILTPSKVDFTALSKNIEDFWPSPDGKKTALLEKNLPLETGWALKLYDLEKNVKSYLIGDKDISQKFPADFINLEWSPDSKEIYLNVSTKENEQNFVLKLDKLPLALIKKTVPTIPQNILTSFNSGGNAYYLDNLGFIYKSDTKLIPAAFPVKAETEYKLNVFNDYIFLREGGDLYYFNKDPQVFEKILERVKDLKLSPDDKKLIIFSASEIWIFYLTDAPTKKAEGRQFLARLSEKIGDIFWLNNDYLILSAGDKIKISETDKRDRVQSWGIGNFSNPRIFFNEINKKLYILSEGSLSSSEKLNY